jgi:hypothetical protein
MIETNCIDCQSIIEEPMQHRVRCCSCRDKHIKLLRKKSYEKNIAEGKNNYHPKPNNLPKPCSICSTIFTPIKHHQIVCSKECQKEKAARYYIDHKAPSILTAQPCVICSTSFTPAKKNSKCCSKECTRINKKNHTTKAHKLNPIKKTKNYYIKKEVVEKNCKKCNTLFTPDRANIQYCSHECRSQTKVQNNKKYHSVIKKPNTRERVENKELYYEIVVSLAMGRLTRRAVALLELIGSKLITKFSYNNTDDKRDCHHTAMYTIYKMWQSFNPDYSNAFAYFSEVYKRGLAAGYKQLYPNGYGADYRLGDSNDGGVFNL